LKFGSRELSNLNPRREFEFERLPSGRYRARVVLEGQPGVRFEGAAAGLGSQAGELRCAAEAAANALGKVTGDKLEFELLGVKSVRAFDATVVIVALSCHEGEEALRLVGSCLTEDSPHRSAAMAVLNATNRYLGNLVFAR
jgi:hypothetical protein